MNAIELIEEIQESASEWIEMSQDPYAVVAGVLANKVISLQSQIKYLENRLKHVSSTSNSRTFSG